MDTRCNTDFTVQFTHIFGDGSSEKRIVPNFVKKLEDWDDSQHRFIEIYENVNLELLFICEQEKAKCYMDGLEVLKNQELTIDEESKEPFLISGQKVTLFKNSSSIYYPYIPAIYRIKIELLNETYFSFIKVISNRLTEDQLDSMRNEVEEQIRGLALDMIRKQNVRYNLDSSILNPALFQRFKILDQRFTEISAIVSDLIKCIRFTLSKEYKLQPVDRPAHMDEISIRHRLQHPGSTNFVKSPKKNVDYNLPENRLLKVIIEKWLRLLGDFVESAELGIDRLTGDNLVPTNTRKKQVNELSVYRDRASQMMGALTMLKEKSWYQQITNQYVQGVPMKMYVDVRYRFIWQIDRLLFSEEIDLALHPEWFSHWKRTDQLYEIWSYLKVLHTLQSGNHGFEYTSGWLFKEKDRQEIYVIPMIVEGTKVMLSKGDIRLSVIYDRLIPSNQADTDLENPIYTTATNNKPDIRIDVYIQEIFVGTILLEVKYRKKQALLDTDVEKQLTSYADNIRSPFIFNKKKRWEKLRPVHQVLVVYPQKWGETEVESFEGRSISLIPLTPATNHKVFNETIQRLIEELIVDAEDEGIMCETILTTSVGIGNI